MNLIEVVDYCAVLLEDPGHYKIPLSVLTTSINSTQSYLHNLVCNSESDLTIATVEMTPVTEGVALPVDFLRARDINVNGVPVEIVQPQQRHHMEGTLVDWDVGRTGAYYCYFRGSKVYFYSGLVGGTDVTFTYTRRLPKLHRGNPQAISDTSITLASDGLIGSIETSDDYYCHATVTILAGTGLGQEREITGYVGSTKVATVAEWDVNPDTSSVYEIKCELPEDPDFHITLCDIVSEKLGKSKGNKQVWEDLDMKLSQLSSRNSQNAWIIM